MERRVRIDKPSEGGEGATPLVITNSRCHDDAYIER